MTLLKTLFYVIYFVLQIGIIRSSVTNRYLDDLDGKNVGFPNGNSATQGDLNQIHDENPNSDENILFRNHDYCSFTKLEEKIEVLPDPEDCNRINEQFQVNENYNFINYFGYAFELMKKGADSLALPVGKMKMNTIFFIGNTGAGKSTLVQILGNDNSKIYSKPANKENTEFIIVDNSKIGTNTVVSETIYPEVIVDRETGYALCDNPGFQDTRSPIHEIVAMYSMKKVLQRTNKIKIVMVTTHSSVKEGMYRHDFTNLLKHTNDFFNNLDKYKNSFYLIANKVENTFSYDPISYEQRFTRKSSDLSEQNGIQVVSDSEVIQSIGHFLKGVKSSLSDNKFNFNISSNKPNFVKNAVKVIDGLLENDGNTYKRINIFRKPAEQGPVSDIYLLQSERNIMRNTLLNDDNMVNVNDGDIGFVLSDSAVMYLNDLFQRMNSYITDLSQLISMYVTTYYRTLVSSKTDINEATDVLLKIKTNVKKLSSDIEKSENPTEYIKIISKFSEKNKMKLDCLTNFKNISTLNEYLSNLDSFLTSKRYTPMYWSRSIERISEYVNESLKKYQFLQNLYRYLNSYELQKIRKSYDIVLGKVDELFRINLNNDRSRDYRDDDELAQKISEVLKINVKHRRTVSCGGDVLTIIDYIILMSELKENYFSTCEGNKIVILAMHTIYIDQDLDNDWLKGKYLTIIAPIWDVRGSRKISVDGVTESRTLPKADIGEIGKHGLSGHPGGKFYGIGMTFVNGENLVISASGGDGQDGQEGGDGIDGRTGTEGEETKKELVDESGISFSGFGYKDKTYVARGATGSIGGDAGAGGKGGFGGKKGFVIIHNIGDENHGITLVMESGKQGKQGKDGKPGKGGIKGCDQVIKKQSISAFGITIDLNSNKDQVNCGLRNDDGRVVKSTQQQVKPSENKNNNDSPVCVHIMTFQNYYLQELHPFLNDGLTKKFVTDMKLTKY